MYVVSRLPLRVHVRLAVANTALTPFFDRPFADAVLIYVYPPEFVFLPADCCTSVCSMHISHVFAHTTAPLPCRMVSVLYEFSTFSAHHILTHPRYLATQFMAVATNDMRVSLFSVQSYSCVWSRACTHHELPITCLAFSADDKNVVSVSVDQSCEFHEVRPRRPAGGAPWIPMLLIILAVLVLIVAFVLRNNRFAIKQE